MKIAVCIATGNIDIHGYLERYAAGFAQAGAARGIEVEIIRYPHADFYSRLFANLATPDCIVHFYGYVFDLPPVKADGLTVNPFDVCSATVVTSIGDHPFSSFMHRTVLNAHPRMRFAVMDNGFKDEMLSMNPILEGAYYDHQPVPPPTNFNENDVRPFDDREFDLVVPMYICDMAGHDMQFVLSKLRQDWFAKIIAETYETSRATPNKSPCEIFTEVFQSTMGLSLGEVSLRNPAIVPQILNAVTAVDSIIRQERRRDMAARLLRSVDGLKVAMTCDPFPDLTVDDNVQFLGRRSADDVSALMANSRAILNCNPSYPSSLHERIVSGMMSGSCVITDLNAEVSRRFADDDLIAYAPELDQSLEDIFASRDVAAIAHTGKCKVSEDRSYSWNGHIDRLVRAAAA